MPILHCDDIQFAQLLSILEHAFWQYAPVHGHCRSVDYPSLNSKQQKKRIHVTKDKFNIANPFIRTKPN